MIINCKKCGTGTPTKYGNFCGGCGKRNIEPRSERRYCTCCSKERARDDYRYCSYCGNGDWKVERKER